MLLALCLYRVARAVAFVVDVVAYGLHVSLHSADPCPYGIGLVLMTESVTCIRYLFNRLKTRMVAFSESSL